MKNRIVDHPVLGKLSKKKVITFTYDGEQYEGLEGDTIASALLANGIRKLRVHESSSRPRGIYCNIGHCFECRVTVENQEGIRACLTPIKNNMSIESGKAQAQPFKDKQPHTYADFLEDQVGDLDV